MSSASTAGSTRILGPLMPPGRGIASGAIIPSVILAGSFFELPG